MGPVALLKLAAKSFDLLAWPLITMVYPLYASIQAIERKSNSDNQKWLTYWVLYCLILLFEFASAKVLECLPLWPYLKLIAMTYLVLPYFNGAAYIYEEFVRPCFLVNTQALSNWFIQQRGNFIFARSDDFLIAAERYINENGSDALEKLISSKAKPTSVHAEHNLTETETKTVITKEKVKLAVSEMVKLREPYLCLTENRGGPAKENIAIAAGAGEARGCENPDLPVPKKPQKEWPCAICKLTFQSEVVLNDHLGGKKHMVKEKQLKENKMEEKTSAQTKSIFTIEAKNLRKEKEKDVECIGYGKKMVEKNLTMNEICIKESPLWCSKCKVWCNSITVMEAHLSGKKHKAQL